MKSPVPMPNVFNVLCTRIEEIERTQGRRPTFIEISKVEHELLMLQTNLDFSNSYPIPTINGVDIVVKPE